jgi:hypothetical protein
MKKYYYLYMKKIFFSLIVLVLVPFAAAQDFGYEYAALSEYRAVAVSYNLQKFSALPSHPPVPLGPISITSPLPCIEFRQNTGRLAIGYQTYSDSTTRSKESFSVYAESHSDFSLTGSRKDQGYWFIPVIVGANYVRAQVPDATKEDFDVGSFGLGTGMKFKYFDRSYGFQAFVTGSLYYASEGFSTDYGTQTSIAGEVQLILPELLYDGILIGYRYESQQWNMNNNTLDYQRYYSGLFIGILF